MAGRVTKWNAAGASNEFADRAVVLMGRATRAVEREAKVLVSRTQPTMRSGAGRRGLDPSLPGEPPKVVTGVLRANIAQSVERTQREVIGFIGVRKGFAPYARRLEMGFVGRDRAGRMVSQGPRPYLRPALFGKLGKVREIFGVE